MDKITKEQRSHIMSTIKSKNTKPELRIKKLMMMLHFSYQPKGIFGNPDFANKEQKIAVFVDGCFWHGCKRHFKKPTSNVQFWSNKISRNIRHDKEVSSTLRKNGWRVIRVWEHDLKDVA